MIKVYYTSKFVKSFKKLPKNIQNLAVRKIKIFEVNPFELQLKTHKLIGSLGGFYSFSINYSYRILFKFESNKEATLLNVGTHSIYN